MLRQEDGNVCEWRVCVLLTQCVAGTCVLRVLRGDGTLRWESSDVHGREAVRDGVRDLFYYVCDSNSILFMSYMNV